MSRTPVAVRSKEYVCGGLMAVIVGSNPTEAMDVRPLCLLCLVNVGAFATGLITRSKGS
jgi:hypothetical protein